MEQFHRAYNEAFQKAKAFQEIHDILSMAETTIQNITKQLNEPKKNYEI